MAVEASWPPAPDWVVGLWRRESIALADGTVDRRTRVYWGQTKTYYVDIRIPPDRPNRQACRSLEDLTLEEIRQLARQKGFAGRILLAGAQCTWVRHIDYQPDTGRPDTGLLRLDGDVLYETGEATSVIGSGYEETYHRERRGGERRIALRLEGAAGEPFGGEMAHGATLVVLDDHFLFARPRTVPLPRAETLEGLIDSAGGDRSRIHAYLDCEVALGRVDAPRAWTIELSTVPFREGSRLFDPGLVVIDDDGESLRIAGAGRWRIVESTMTPDALAALLAAP